MINSRKKLVCRFVFFVSIIASVDFIIGSFLSNIDRAECQNRSIGYILNKVNADILVFGSSRALYHYNTKMLSDSLHQSAYNCGQREQGFIQNYALLSGLQNRYRPHLIIYDLNPLTDFMKSNHAKSMKGLRPYYDITSVKEVLLSYEPLEKYKNISLLYRYNDDINSLIYNYIFSQNEENESINGFVPVHKKMRNDRNFRRSLLVSQIDDFKTEYADKFIQKSKGAKLIFVMSPRWYGMESVYVNAANEFAKKNNVMLLDFSINKKYVHNDEYFYDGTHLNDKGADVFTNDLIKALKDNTII